MGAKYRFIHQNFTEKQRGYGGAKWQYWVDDSVDGKQVAWYDYSTLGSIQVEQLFQEHAINARLTNRLVDSGVWTYDVNLVQMIQTNVKHPGRTSRRIRRFPVGEDMDDHAPPVAYLSVATYATPQRVLSAPTATPSSPVKSSSAALVTPTPSPVKSANVYSTVSSSQVTPKKEKKSASPPVDVDIDQYYYATTPSSSFSVAKNADDEWYDVVLNQCNITGGSNNNKYYRMQLLNANNTGAYYVWTKWGRVGEASTANAKDLKGPFPTEDAALKLFAKKYRDKTKNTWGAVNFVPQKNKYTRIQIDNEVEVKQEANVTPVKVKAEKIEYLPSVLHPKTKELVEVIFSKDMRDEALTVFNLDLKRLPLGVPSEQQIEIGVSILNEIESKLNGDNVPDSCAELSSRFYTAIPHSFGRQRPPALDTNALLQQRYDMCNILLDMFSTNETMRKIEEEKEIETKQVPYPADSHYKSLNADLSFVNKNSQEYKLIQKYFDKTKSSGSLCDVWSVDRHGEQKRCQNFDRMDNRRLLWHGTNIAVVAPIITSGLRIMPHSGGRVGAGIYLASMQEKSASYTSGYGAKYACMFLCEGTLGKIHEVTQDGAPSRFKKAPAGFDSVHAVGSVTPKAWGAMKLDGKTVEIPQAEATQSGVSSSFHHDEYLVYDEAQVRLRYVVTVKLY